MCILPLGENGLEKYRLSKKWEQFKIVLLFMDHRVYYVFETKRVTGKWRTPVLPGLAQSRPLVTSWLIVSTRAKQCEFSPYRTPVPSATEFTSVVDSGMQSHSGTQMYSFRPGRGPIAMLISFGWIRSCCVALVSRRSWSGNLCWRTDKASAKCKPSPAYLNERSPEGVQSAPANTTSVGAARAPLLALRGLRLVSHTVG